ncbi:M48 family metalloprotease [Variovorax sp. PCZ-1]|uniref:M48 family metalloprotease n=1 Tax=Variovorax sp. PCZ-1 TaxID=2835533 RepID=UPI001BCEEE9A|nr:M48 family metalloprotease [Variovorax sp. PCZ-1]MBS7808166.1 M48 family metalloprotease [Variovorax sp. PCZ-1]
MKIFFTLLLSALLAACAGTTTRPVEIDKKAEEAEAMLQRELAFEGFLEDELRIKRVAQPILLNATELCKDKTRFDTGATFTSAGAYGKDYEPVVTKYLGISGNELGLLHVIPGSPADLAGLKRGDRIISVNGFVIPNTKEAPAELGKRAQEWLKKPDPIVTVYSRQAASGVQTATASVTPIKACDFPAFLVMQESLNAYADGKAIAIFRGMLRFANDNELAIVIGHELAHNFMGHIEASQRNNVLGTIAEIIAASRGVPTQGALGAAIALSYSPAFEAEADYVGLYVLARAGIEIKDAPKFWRRMAAANPAGISQRGMIASHPATSARFVALEKTVQEIEAKRASGQALNPELKTDNKADTKK